MRVMRARNWLGERDRSRFPRLIRASRCCVKRNGDCAVTTRLNLVGHVSSRRFVRGNERVVARLVFSLRRVGSGKLRVMLRLKLARTNQRASFLAPLLFMRDSRANEFRALSLRPIDRCVDVFIACEISRSRNEYRGTRATSHSVYPIAARRFNFKSAKRRDSFAALIRRRRRDGSGCNANHKVQTEAQLCTKQCVCMKLQSKVLKCAIVFHLRQLSLLRWYFSRWYFISVNSTPTRVYLEISLQFLQIFGNRNLALTSAILTSSSAMLQFSTEAPAR